MKDFNINLINSGKHIIYTKSISDYNKALSLLKMVSSNFYTYTPKNQKNQTFLLKGLSQNNSCTEILEELNSLAIPDLKFIKVSAFSTKKSIKNEKILPIHIVQISPDSNPNKLKDIRSINYQKIQWDKLRKSEITQCFNCQHFGHTSSNCNLPYRCVKCNVNHGPNECKLDKNVKLEKKEIYCANCKNFGHPASYRGCPKILEIKKKLRLKLAENKDNIHRKLQVINNYVRPNMSYANSLKTSTSSPISSQNENLLLGNTPNAENPIQQILQSFEKFQAQLLTTIENQQKQIDNLSFSLQNTEKRLDNFFHAFSSNDGPE